MQQEIVTLILNKLAQARSRNPNYSLRALANNLGIQPSAISEILNGKRVITKKMGKKLLDGLGVGPIESDKLDETKKMIKAFRRKLSEKLESGNKKEVYKLEILLFPLSREMKKNENV